ncbi:MAG TPA: lytic murein transglycosylase [Solimonas sp.]
MRPLAPLALLLVLPLTAAADYAAHPRAPALLDALRREHGFSASELQQVSAALAQAKQLPQLVQQEQKAPERTETWTQYARRIDSGRIDGGAALLRENPQLFARAEAEFGVPGAVIAAVLGIETRYGRVTGSVRVLDALSTQGFDHPTRSPFFFGELTEFFAFCRDFGFAPEVPKGSYAGAMGFAQFMPSNYRRLALDYDGDGRRDLWTLADAVGSIGHYFQRYRPDLAWRRGEPLAVPARLTGTVAPVAEYNKRDVFYRAGDLAAAGLVPAVELPPSMSVGLIELPLDDGGKEYWIGLPNFYAVMTYNPRIFYAMAVTQLAAHIEAARVNGP